MRAAVALALLCAWLCIALAMPAAAETGIASWYGNENGQWRMANGRRYYPDRISCAHKTIKLGTQVRVTNLSNGRSIVCPVLDRGPYAPGRVLDLSRGAARAIGAGGLTRVRIEIIRRAH